MHRKWEGLCYNIFVFLFLSVIYFLLRLDTFFYVFSDNFLKLIDPDSYYHLRRIIYTINHYPKTLNFDYFLSYPFGDYVPWPPLFDLLSATFLLPFKNPLFIVPSLDMFYFYVAFALLYFTLARFYNLETSLITAFFMASSGILRIYTSFGRLDHHALELLIITFSYLTFCFYWKKRGVLFLLLFTLSLCFAFFNWPGSIIYYPPLILFVFYKLYKKEILPDVFKGLFVAFHITAIIIAIYLRLTKTAFYPPYSYKFLSGFQRDFCFIISIIFFNVYFSFKGKIKPFLLWFFAVFILSLGFHKFFFELFNGFRFVGKLDSLYSLAEETAPLFFSNFYTFQEEITRSISLFTPVFFIFPYIFYIYQKKYGFDLLFFYSLFFLLLTFLQLRFGYFFMLSYGVMIGIWAAPFIKQTRKSFVFIIMLLLALFIFYENYQKVRERFESDALYDAMKYLREKTPQRESFENGKTPYGVLSPWHLGHYIITLANRPTVAHNFIGVAKNNDVTAFVHALFAKNEEDVVKIMKAKRARFLIIDDLNSLILTDWTAISDKPNPYVSFDRRLNEKAYELFLYRLYHHNGLIPPFQDTPRHFRLIFHQKDIKIFELVEGFKIFAPKNAILKAKIKTPADTFSYISTGDSIKGQKVFIFPYSLDAPYLVKAEEIYLEIDGKKRFLNVTEENIIRPFQ